MAYGYCNAIAQSTQRMERMRGDVAFRGEGKSMEAGRIRNNLHYSAASCVGIVEDDGVYAVSCYLVAGTCPYDWGTHMGVR